VMLGLGMLMISNVQYAKVPTVGFRTIKGLLGLALVIGTLVGVIFLPKQFFFPALMGYVLYGIGQTVLFGLLERLPGTKDDDQLHDDHEASALVLSQRQRRLRRRQLKKKSGKTPPSEDSTA
jgi:CDP-diacylglycerol---serine O-phosphatidyltransferase